MLGYNMFAYCNNNPVMYVDFIGETAEGILNFWNSVGSTIIQTPTWIDDLIWFVGALILGGVAIEGIEENNFPNPMWDLNYQQKFIADTTTPQQSINTINYNVDNLSPTISEAKNNKTKYNSKKSKYTRKKAAPRIKSNSKKSAREQAFHKGGKKQPIHHPNGKYGSHYHPNNPKFSRWHYYYIIIFSMGDQTRER